MTVLERENIIHRDLGANNVLVGGNNIFKVALSSISVQAGDNGIHQEEWGTGMCCMCVVYIPIILSYLYMLLYTCIHTYKHMHTCMHAFILIHVIFTCLHACMHADTPTSLLIQTMHTCNAMHITFALQYEYTCNIFFSFLFSIYIWLCNFDVLKCIHFDVVLCVI